METPAAPENPVPTPDNTGDSNGDTGSLNSDKGVPDDKGAGDDKLNNLNNIDSGASAPANATNTDTAPQGANTGTADSKDVPDKDPVNGVILPESQDGAAFNQSSSTTKLPEVLPDITTAGTVILPEKPEIKPVQDVTVGEPVTTESTTTTKQTTTEEPTTQSTTTAKPSQPIIIDFPNSAKTEPPYAIVTNSSPTNGTFIGPGEDQGSSSKGAIVIASSLIGVLLLVILIVVVVIWLLRRKRKRSKDIIQTVENPRYVAPAITRTSPPSSAPHPYRFSRDADISIGEMKHSNNNLKPSPMFGKKGLLSYSPSGSASSTPSGSLHKKRKAPPPPNPFGDPTYYERDDEKPLKDSDGSGYEMTTFGNVSTFGKGAAPSPPKAKSDGPEDAAKEPLLNGKAGNKEPKRSGDYSSSSSSSSEDEDEKSDIQKAVEDKFKEHRNSSNYSALKDDDETFEEDYDQKLNPFSEVWDETKKE